MHDYYVYILTNPAYTVLYVGMTNDLERRLAQHQTAVQPGFTNRTTCRCWSTASPPQT